MEQIILPLEQIKPYYAGVYDKYVKLLDRLDHHLLIAGQTGSGKDTLAFLFLMIDRYLGRNVIVFDPKGEYIGMAFPNIKPQFQEYMELLAEGVKITIWIPCTTRTPNNPEFIKLMKFGEAHPKITIRPFRLRFKDIRNQDAVSFALGLSQLQTMAMRGGTDAGGMAEYFKKRRMDTGEHALFIDFEEDKQFEGAIEYINFNDLFDEDNKSVHIFLYKFLLDESTAVTTAGMSALLTEVMSRVTTLNVPTRICISELAILTPQEASSKMAEAAAGLRTKIGQLIRFARSGGGRLMLVSQQVTDYSAPTVSQAKEVFVGRIRGRELQTLGELFRLAPDAQKQLANFDVGRFMMMQKGLVQKFPSPPSYKPDERETMIDIIKKWFNDPLSFCVTKYAYAYSDLPFVDHHVTAREFLELFEEWIAEHKELQLPKIYSEQERAIDALRENAKPLWLRVNAYRGKDINYGKGFIRPSTNDLLIIMISEYLANIEVDKRKTNYSRVDDFLRQEGIDLRRVRNRTKQIRVYNVPHIFKEMVSEDERQLVYDCISDNMDLVLKILREEQMDYVGEREFTKPMEITAKPHKTKPKKWVKKAKPEPTQKSFFESEADGKSRARDLFSRSLGENRGD